MNELRRDEVLVHLHEFKEKNRKKYHIIKLGLFGSFTRNTVQEFSDIDIAVELEKPRMFDMIGIKQDLEGVFHRSVDIVRIRKNMNQFLKKRIDEEGVFV